LGSSAIAIQVNDIIAQIALWGGALVIVAFRRRAVAVVRV
jgi:hypothetical protein